MYSVRYTTNVLPIYVNILNKENNTNRSRGGGISHLNSHDDEHCIMA